MYKSIVFDLGGVMIDFDPRGYLVDRLCNAETEEEVYDLTFGSEEWKLLDAGLISRFDGNHRMLEKARAAGRAFEVQGVLDDWLHILRPRHRMEELVRRLKSHGYCVYYLSNIPQDVLDLLRDRGVLDGFDGGVASCEVPSCCVLQVHCSVTLICGRSHLQPATLWQHAQTSQVTPMFSILITSLQTGCPVCRAIMHPFFALPVLP